MCLPLAQPLPHRPLEMASSCKSNGERRDRHPSENFLLSNMLLMAPPAAEASALVALMLLHDSRRDARVDEAGDLVVLEEQDRSRWNQQQIAEALPLVDEALRGRPGPFALQAAIAAEHCKAARAEDTNWRQKVQFYDLLERVQPSPIVSLNRAVAIAMLQRPEPARADLLRRIGSLVEAAKDYERALALVTNPSERRFLQRRLREVQPAVA